MIELKALKCQCCGGKINRTTMKCEYCGTEYIIKDDMVFRIESYTNPVKTIRAKTVISDRTLCLLQNDKGFMENCVRNLAHQIAEQLYDSMQIRTSVYPHEGKHMIEAETKVIVPVMTSNEWINI